MRKSNALTTPLVSLPVAVAAVVSSAPPAPAAQGPFLSLGNTDFVVTLGFVVFIGVLLYFRVPNRLIDMLDQRAATIRAELEQARALREEAQALLISCERKQADIAAQAEAIVQAAREEASRLTAQASKDLDAAIARRIATAQDRIATAQAAVARETREAAIALAVDAAGVVIAQGMNDTAANALIETATEETGLKLKEAIATSAH